MSLHLTRIDASKSMARYYKLDVQPDLFGQWVLVREWGRIGRPGTVRMTPYETANEAEQASSRQFNKKLRRGYCFPQ